jgi:hypothetical protein
MKGTGKNRLNWKDRGPGGKRTRTERWSNLPVDDDPQTQLEAELTASGRSDAVRREGLVGAHRVRREVDRPDAPDEPIGGGADVAPTARAADRERERHRLQRAMGVIPAGEDGNLRQLRAPGVGRASLDAAAREADHHG